jgi:hypothetical protein
MGQKYAHLDDAGFVIGFYADDIHADHQIPAGAVPIDDAHHIALIEGQASGKRMKVDKKGKPLLVDPAPPTADQLAASLRVQRNAALAATDWLACRHMDEQMAMQTTTLAPDQVKALGAYRKALRDLPSAKGFPNVALPVAPDFIGAK